MFQKLFAAVLVVSFAFPAGAYAQSATSYQPQSREQIIAYLYGQITQLQILLAEKLAEEAGGGVGVPTPLNTNADVSVSTVSATGIDDAQAVLRGRIDLRTEDEAQVWFEYGQSKSNLNQRTSKKTLTDNRGDTQTFTASVYSLEADERYYYRAVARDENNDTTYGAVLYFTTDDYRSGPSPSPSDSNSDFELSVDDTSVSVGDSVTVSWDMNSSDVNSRNWIGLYKVGNSDKSFVEWKYITTDSGTITFNMKNTGTYDFRLFLNNSYNLETTSSRIIVN